MKYNKFPADRVIGFAAMLISLLTLILFAYQTEIIRNQSRLTVRPRLGFEDVEGIRDDSIIRVTRMLVNRGLGPAIIDSIFILHNNTKYTLDFEGFLKKTYPQIEKYGRLVSNTTLRSGRAIVPNEKLVLFTFEVKSKYMQELVDYLKVQNIETPFPIEVFYSSVYDERWRIIYEDDASGHPEKL